MHETFCIGNCDQGASRQRCRHAAHEELILLPETGTAGHVEGMYSPLVVSDVKITSIDRQTDRARHIACPDEVAVPQVKARNAPLKGHSTYRSPGNNGHTDDIGDTIKLARAFGD